MTRPRRIAIGLAVLAALVALALCAVVAAGRLGALRGHEPAALGVTEGRLRPPSVTPNSVSSQATLWPGHPQLEYARIAPLPAGTDGRAAMRRLAAVVAAMPGATVVTARDDYLYAQFESRWLRFVDDAEFALQPDAAGGPGVIHVRSASRLGRRDFGVNRSRVEAIRARLAAG